MTVRLNDIDYSLYFGHGGSNPTGRDWTTAYLKRRGEDSLLAQAWATVIRDSRDQPNRETARKAAITKMLACKSAGSPRFTKEQRRAVWTAYLNRKKTATTA